jgi:hypothetical protein
MSEPPEVKLFVMTEKKPPPDRKEHTKEKKVNQENHTNYTTYTTKRRRGFRDQN